MPNAVITGTGHYLPPRIVLNKELEQSCDTSDEWIQERTGILQRHFIAPGQTTSELGLFAALEALEAAGKKPADLDYIIFATLSPDVLFPGCGCLLQSRLGVENIPALDIRNQCSGFLYGLQVANALIRSEAARTVLLVGAEVHSTGLDLSPNGREVSVLFGDGAGAVVLEAGPQGRGIIRVEVGADGRHARDLWCEGPGSAEHPERITAQMLLDGRQYPKMKGRLVFRHAVQTMKSSLLGVLDAAGVSVGDLALLIPHQANLRIIEMVTRMLDMPPERVATNIQLVGNTTAGSIPILLDQSRRAGRLNEGDWLAMTAFGSGFTWGSAVIKW
ncbi:MAG: 3-oxoacyl-ACP synthase [Deltaproteobacteria bacterium CG2_30_63_29]|nr:MAG: 3-oxoacyl-ACP synthase [Deltaproteobacteria bacterium CG2_30_63_29]PJB49018.1 MAG: 3-oxoacyl-ACP synthase [Deltaproteobacteria bacterium CG_4_9_14_3_um_filter_63_12]